MWWHTASDQILSAAMCFKKECVRVKKGNEIKSFTRRIYIEKKKERIAIVIINAR